MGGDYVKIHIEEITNENVCGSTQFGKINVIWEGNSPEIDERPEKLRGVIKWNNGLLILIMTLLMTIT